MAISPNFLGSAYNPREQDYLARMYAQHQRMHPSTNYLTPEEEAYQHKQVADYHNARKTHRQTYQVPSEVLDKPEVKLNTLLLLEI